MAAVVSKPPVPQEAYERFRGQWVALREGEIVASADTEQDLVRDENVESSDTLFRVPEDSAHFYSARND